MPDRILQATVLLAFGLISACAPDGPPELRIGLLALEDGPYWQASGEPSIQGARLAVEEINESGGTGIGAESYRLRLIVKKHAARADDAASKARALINQDSVHVLVGPQLSAHAISVAVIADQARVPMISPMSTNPQTTQGREFVFRLATLDDTLGVVLARYAFEELGLTRGAILMDQASAYSRDLSDAFRDAFQAVGGTIPATETYTTDRADDFREQLARIRAADPDFLFLPNGASEAGIQMRQARAMGMTTRFLGSDSWDLLGYADSLWSEGVVVTHQWHYDIPYPEVSAFLRSFRQEYGVSPRTTAAMTYDAVNIMVQAAATAGSLDPEKIRRALENTNDYRGAGGRISFQGRHDPERTITLSTVHEGEVKVLRTIDP